WREDEPMVVAGSALGAFDDLDTGRARRVPHATPSAVAMLPLAQALWSQGGALDAALALPLYVRDKVAQTTAEREAAHAAKQRDATQAVR
ncbi:MAG TPA: hypothetical protein VJ743_13855, partial [Albitalea sp.]|nr:hypothetical protein [Albitalea sp.]